MKRNWFNFEHFRRIELGFNMNCHELAERLAVERPDLPPVEIARLCLIMLNSESSPQRFHDAAVRSSSWRNAYFRFEATADQHAAVVEELEELFTDGPVQFSPDQLWTLLRAVKVQSQMLELYTDHVSLA